MVLAAEVSHTSGLLDGHARDRVRRLIERAGLPVQAPDLGVERWLALMGSDKKVDGGRIRFVLLTAADHAVQGREVPRAVLERCLGAGSAVIAG